MHTHTHTNSFTHTHTHTHTHLNVSYLPSSSEQIEEGGLAAARGPHDANHLPRVEIDGNPLQDLAPVALAAADVVGHLVTALGGLGRGLRGAGRGGRRVMRSWREEGEGGREGGREEGDTYQNRRRRSDFR